MSFNSRPPGVHYLPGFETHYNSEPPSPSFNTYETLEQRRQRELLESLLAGGIVVGGIAVFAVFLGWALRG